MILCSQCVSLGEAAELSVEFVDETAGVLLVVSQQKRPGAGPSMVVDRALFFPIWHRATRPFFGFDCRYISRVPSRDHTG